MSQPYTPQAVESVWHQTRQLLQAKLSPAVFSTWVLANPLTMLEDTDAETTTATITTSSAFHAINLKKNLDALLTESLCSVTQKKVSVTYVIGDAPVTSRGPTQSNRASTNGFQTISPNHTPGAQSEPAAATTLSPSSTPFTSPSVESLFSEENVSSARENLLQSRLRQTGLNPAFTFDNFAVSSSNEMAHAAAVAVSQRLGTSYNPLFLYGDVGVGKTHLMQAIGNAVLSQNPEAAALYCTGEDFTNEIVQAIQTKRASSFKQRYRSVQLLLIDDVQFIAGKQAVQEEFFHTFNSIIKQHGQIILTSDRPPEEISLLERRLRSRFEAGLMVDIGQPSFELRAAILLLKAKSANIPLSLDQAKLIAQSIDSPRRLEGFMTRLRSEIELKKKQFSSSLIEEVLQRESRVVQQKLLLPTQEVIRVVAQYFQIKPLALRGKSREKSLVKARHVCMYILNEDVRLSLVEIGRWFSGRDHTSVLHAVRKITAELTQDALLQREVAGVRAKLKHVEKV